MPTFTVDLDDRLDQNLKDLRTRLHQSSKANTFRLALALLKIATEARDKDLRVVLADNDNEIKQEIVLP